MKIGIFTYFNGCNFGENLQVFTSFKFFSSLGHDVWVVNYSKDGEPYPYHRYPEKQAIAHKSFAETRLKLTELVSQDDLPKFIKDNHFDVVAFGADAVWNKRDRVDLAVYSAQWLNDVVWERPLRVIGLSPAFMGTTYSDLTEIEKDNFRKGILNFTYPNVRDEWTRDIVNKEIMGSDYIKTINPDPVFLLNELCPDKWDSIQSGIVSKNYYVMTLPNNCPALDGWLRRFRKEVNQRGYKLVELPLPDGESNCNEFDFKVPYPIDPLQWFLWLKNAKAFVGLRFHAVVSCISAGTPFYSLDVYGRIPRWLYYLNRLGFHKKDRVLNTQSKIRNLLEGSGLENFRMNGIYVNRLNPKSLIKKLESCDIRKIAEFRDKNVSKFKKNMDEALNNPIPQSIK